MKEKLLKHIEEMDELDKKQDEILEASKDISKLKNERYTNFLKENIGDITEKISLLQRIDNAVKNKEGLSKHQYLVMDLYHKAFDGIIGGRVETKIPIPKDIRNWVMEDNIWINCKGIAYKHKEQTGFFYAKYQKRTRGFTKLEVIKRLMVDYPNLRNYIPKKDSNGRDKRVIFDIFRDFFLDWKTPSGIDIKQKYKHIKIYIPKYSFSNQEYLGMRNMYLDKKDALNLKVNTWNGITLEFTKSDSNDWRNEVYISPKNDYTLLDKFIIFQIPQKVVDDLKHIADDLEEINNKSALKISKLQEDISPYILHRLL